MLVDKEYVGIQMAGLSASVTSGARGGFHEIHGSGYSEGDTCDLPLGKV